MLIKQIVLRFVSNCKEFSTSFMISMGTYGGEISYGKGSNGTIYKFEINQNKETFKIRMAELLDVIIRLPLSKKIQEKLKKW